MSVILKAEHLHKEFYTRKKIITAVEDVSFSLHEGKCIGIVGESGSGKSTIARMLAHLTPVTSGKIFLKEKDITDLKGKELQKTYRKMQMIFQMPMESFDPRCTLKDGIIESLVNAGRSKKEIEERVSVLRERCSLSEEIIDRYPYQVSGGQCQRAAIVRALAIEPDILICDEATSALDVTVQKQIMDLLMVLKKDGISFLFICHDLALVQQFCDEIKVMHEGIFVESGTPEEVINAPKTEYTKQLIASVL